MKKYLHMALRHFSCRASYVSILFQLIFAQVLLFILIAAAKHRNGYINNSNNRPSWISDGTIGQLSGSALLKWIGSVSPARQQLNFVQNERSWLSVVYRDESTPALKRPDDIFNTSIPLADFCEAKRNVSDHAHRPRYAVFQNVMLVARQLLLPSSIDCDQIPDQQLDLKTLYHIGQNSTPALEARVVPNTDSFEDFESAYSCHERVYEPSVLFSIINWPQHGHALFNGLSLLWEAFEHSETGPLSRAGKNVRLYAYGDAINADRRQEWQQYSPFFSMEQLETMMAMFTQQPVRSLASLLMQSDRHPICFAYLLAGISGELDHYNFYSALGQWRQFARAVREHFGVPATPRLNQSATPLQRVVAPTENDSMSDKDHAKSLAEHFAVPATPRLSRSTTPLQPVLGPQENYTMTDKEFSELGEIRPIDWTKLEDRPRLVILDRRDNRVIVNVKELLQIARSNSHFKSASIVYLEDLSMDQQIRLVGETDLLFGIDGTGLMSGMFMPEGGVVAHVRPYGCAEFLPGKGRNFDRLFSASPGRVIRYESGDKNSTVFPVNLPEREELVFNPNSTEAYRFPFILRQDTIINHAAFRCILDSGAQLLYGVSINWTEYNQCTKNVFF